MSLCQVTIDTPKPQPRWSQNPGENARWLHDHAQAHAHGQKVAQGDRPMREHGVVDRPVEPLQDLAPGQLRQQPIDRLVEPQPAFLHQDHRCHRR
jgi:hypothetical protein